MPPGQRADGLHFLRLPKLLLHCAVVRDVLGRADDAVDAAGLVVDWKRAVANPAHGAVGPRDAVRFVVVAARLLRHRRPSHALPIFRMNALQPRVRLRVEALARAAPDRFVTRADVEHPVLFGVDVDHPKDLADVFDHLPELRLAVAQSRLGTRAGCDILPDAGHADNESPTIPECGVVPDDLPQLSRPRLDWMLVVRWNLADVDGVEKQFLHRGGRIRQEVVEPRVPDHLLPLPACQAQQKIVAESHRAVLIERQRDEIEVLQQLAEAAIGFLEDGLGPLALGDVRPHSDQLDRFAGPTADQPPSVVDPAIVPVLVAQSVFRATRAPLKRVGHAVHGPLPIVRVQLPEPPFIARRLRHGEAQQSGDVFADEVRDDFVAIQLQHVEHRGAVLEQLVQLRVRDAERLVRLPPLGDVGADGNVLAGFALLVEERHDRRVHPVERAVLRLVLDVAVPDAPSSDGRSRARG